MSSPREVSTLRNLPARSTLIPSNARPASTPAAAMRRSWRSVVGSLTVLRKILDSLVARWIILAIGKERATDADPDRRGRGRDRALPGARYERAWSRGSLRLRGERGYAAGLRRAGRPRSPRHLAAPPGR